MKVTNIGTKIVNIGSEILLPDKTIEIADEVANAPSVKALVNAKFLKIEGGKKAKTEDTPAEEAKAPAEDKAESTAAEGQTEEKKAPRTVSDLKK